MIIYVTILDVAEHSEKDGTSVVLLGCPKNLTDGFQVDILNSQGVRNTIEVRTVSLK